MNSPLAAPAHAPADYRARFTLREFREIVSSGAFAGMKVELVRGELERMTPPMATHSHMQTRVMALLLRAVEGSAWAAMVEVGIDLGLDTLVAADVALSQPVDEQRWLRPDEVLLAVEISSTTLSRDLGTKRLEYARAGVADYWVVDVDGRMVHRFAEPVDGDYNRLPAVRFGEPLPVPGTDRTITLG